MTRRKLIRPEQEYLRYNKGFVRFTVLMVKLFSWKSLTLLSSHACCMLNRIILEVN